MYALIAILLSGVIHTTSPEVIEWYNMDGHVFNVEYRVSLTDGSWTNVGEGYNAFEHNNPEGFYRVLRSQTDVVFPVYNSGNSNMTWWASTSSEYASIECLNTNLIPEWGEGYLIVRTQAPSGTQIVVDVYATDDQHKQVTVNVK